MKEPVTEVKAVGIPVLTDKVDIAHARIEFAGGAVANVTASRVSTERVRKLRLFQPQQYLSLDYGRQDLAVFSVRQGQIGFEPAPVTKTEPLQSQLNAFLEALETRKLAKCDGLSARRTLEVALSILDKIKEHSDIVSRTRAGWKP